MESKRPERKKTGFTQSLTDGHTLRAIARTSKVPINVQMTATVTDYAGADPRMLTYNTKALASGEVSAKLQQGGGWIDNQGLSFVMLKGDLNSEEVVQELDGRFKDGSLSFAAPSQNAEFSSIKGGWERPYRNVLDFDEQEQQKSVIAVKSKYMKEFKLHLPFTNDVVGAVLAAICEQVPEYEGKLVPVEYTFFYGTSKAACTKWHSDSDEHKGVVLELTSLTLLTDAGTSMNVGTKHETWLRKPFDTVLFDPALYHRSGATSYLVIKLSIHWKLRSGSAADAGCSSPAQVKKEILESSPNSKGLVEPPAEAQVGTSDEPLEKKPKLEQVKCENDAVPEGERASVVKNEAEEEEHKPIESKTTETNGPAN